MAQKKNINNIVSDFNSITTFNDIIDFCNNYDKQSIFQLLVSYNGAYLASSHGEKFPTTISGTTDVRRVIGAGLRVFSETCKKVSDQTKYCADLILNHIKLHGFVLYNKIDGIIAYICKML